MSRKEILNNRLVNIYMLIDPRDVKFNPRYIGITVGSIKNRFARHMLPSSLKKETYKNNWIKKMLKDSIMPQVILIDTVDSWEEACTLEIGLIKTFKEKGFKLTNITAGGDGTLGLTGEKSHMYGRCGPLSPTFGKQSTLLGTKIPEERKLKISIGNKGKVVSEDSRLKMSNSWEYDSHFNDEVRTKLSTGKKKLWENPEYREKMCTLRKERFSQIMTEKNREIVICPYCGKSGGRAGMQKSHFNNCKFKP